MSGREDSDYDEELDADFEASISGDERHEVDSNSFQPSLNVRIRRRGDSSVNTCHTSSSFGSPRSSPRSDKTVRQVWLFSVLYFVYGVLLISIL